MAAAVRSRASSKDQRFFSASPAKPLRVPHAAAAATGSSKTELISQALVRYLFIVRLLVNSAGWAEANLVEDSD
jgi:hypothetical protein